MPRCPTQAVDTTTNEILAVPEITQTNWVVLTNFVVARDPYLWTDTAPPAARRFYRVRMLLPAGMVLIPTGAFQMGDPFNEGNADERPIHGVAVSGFCMDRLEVTKALWDTVKAWSAGRGYAFDHAGAGKAPNHPVQSINVWEWCWDWYASYGSAAQSDPRGPTTGSKRVNRGGSWFAYADGCRVSDRSGLYPTNTYDTLGLRCVLSLAPP